MVDAIVTPSRRWPCSEAPADIPSRLGLLPLGGTMTWTELVLVLLGAIAFASALCVVFAIAMHLISVS
jgi:hypothetical protein